MVKHVLIVGAGLGGPALALALAKHDIQSTLLEIRSKRSDSGGSITLAPNALRPLDKCCGVYKDIKETGYSYTRVGAYDETGYCYGDSLVGEETEGGYPSIRIMRSALHKIFLDECDRRSNLIKIVWGVRLESISETERGVTAYFEDGSSYHGDCLVGADGIHSKVREHVLGKDAPNPIYSGSCTVSGYTTASQVVRPSGMTLPAAIFTDVGLVMALPVEKDGQTIGFGVSESLTEEKGRKGWTEYLESGAAARAARKHYADCQTQPIRSLIDNMDDKSVKLWAPYSIPDLEKWHSGRTCLLGDAAHALPPNGQGSAMAFEDAAILSRLLAELQSQEDKQGTSSYANLFKQFEKLRRPRIAEVKKIAKTAGGVKSTKTSAVKWWLMKWAIYFYFAYNRFLIRPSTVLDYDVNEQKLHP